MLKKILKKFLKRKYLQAQSFISDGDLKGYGAVYKTDKIDQYHSFAGKTYLDIYSMYLSPIRHAKIVMLEIGIKGGASLRTFRDFFPLAQIVGLDIDPTAAFKEKRISTFTGSQSSQTIIDEIFESYPEIMVVLDDGSHVNKLTIESFNLIFSRLQKGGYYIIEDLGCSYLESKLQDSIKIGSWPGMDLNEPEDLIANHRSDMDDFFQCLIKDLDHRKGEIEFVHFWSQLCVIKKID